MTHLEQIGERRTLSLPTSSSTGHITSGSSAHISLCTGSPHAAHKMWIKICGITRQEDAIAAVTAGASAIGLNFFCGSKRFVSVERAIELTEAARAVSIDRPADIVGVFVNSTPEEVSHIARTVSLTAVQFHGDESIDEIAAVHAALPGIRMVRAFRVTTDRIDQCLRDLDLLQETVPLAACLLDAFVPGEYGGTGASVDLSVIEKYFARPRPRLILAGGLAPDNVEHIAALAKPWGVDTASGVESSPGRKDRDKIRQFVQAALRASSASHTTSALRERL